MDKEEQLDVLAAGNALARRWSKKILGNRRRAIFHQVLMHPEKAEKLKISQQELLEIKFIPVLDVEKIKAGWALTDQLWKQYKRLVYRLAGKICNRLDQPNLRSDMEGEAHVAFMKACRGYDDRNYSFGAYLGITIYSELRRYAASQKGLGGLDADMLEMYNKKQQELAIAGEPSTFEDVVEKLGWGDKLKRSMWGALQVPIHEAAGDFSTRWSVANEVRDNSAKPVDTELIKALGMVELSLLERDAWVSSGPVRELFPDSMESIREVAICHEVTTSAVVQAANRANAKIRRQLVESGY